MKKRFLHLFHAIGEGRFLYLLVALLLYMVLPPFLKRLGLIRLNLLYDIYMMFVLLAAVFAVSERKLERNIAIVLVVPIILGLWLYKVKAIPALGLLFQVPVILFFGYAVISILGHIFRRQEVTLHIIFAAVSVYLLLGICWSSIFVLIERFIPGSFNMPGDTAMITTSTFTYFSFVTLTTLGYGDITPVSSEARALATIEAVLGQIYMTVLIAWLVGVYVSRKGSEKGNRR